MKINEASQRRYVPDELSVDMFHACEMNEQFLISEII